MSADLTAAIAPVCVTLNAIREHGPCSDGWKKLLAHLGKTQSDDEPLPLLTILESNGLDDAIWALRALPDADMPKARLFAVACARDVQHLMADPRSVVALDVAERYAKGEATDSELAAAWAAAGAAWAAAGDARFAARAAWAASDAAGAAAWAAAWAAAGDARDAARAAWAAARDAAWAASDAAREKQRGHFIRIFGGSND